MPERSKPLSRELPSVTQAVKEHWKNFGAEKMKEFIKSLEYSPDPTTNSKKVAYAINLFTNHFLDLPSFLYARKVFARPNEIMEVHKKMIENIAKLNPKTAPNKQHVINNIAWILSTSPMFYAPVIDAEKLPPLPYQKHYGTQEIKGILATVLQKIPPQKVDSKVVYLTSKKLAEKLEKEGIPARVTDVSKAFQELFPHLNPNDVTIAVADAAAEKLEKIQTKARHAKEDVFAEALEKTRYLPPHELAKILSQTKKKPADSQGITHVTYLIDNLHAFSKINDEELGEFVEARLKNIYAASADDTESLRKLATNLHELNKRLTLQIKELSEKHGYPESNPLIKRRKIIMGKIMPLWAKIEDELLKRSMLQQLAPKK
ncbi:MAG: hypothetical protein ACP5O3_02195 [Candidatus Micrarchaeia archaeon]|jgi:hypothetical protein